MLLSEVMNLLQDQFPETILDVLQKREECRRVHMGVSLNGGTPISHPKVIIFSRKTHGFVGETQHFRKPPHQIAPQQTSAKNPPASPVGGSSHGFSSLRDLSLQRSRGHKLAKVIHPPPSNRNAVPVDILQWQLLNRFLTKSTCFVVDFLSH